jgi:hypothetical protein
MITGQGEYVFSTRPFAVLAVFITDNTSTAVTLVSLRMIRLHPLLASLPSTHLRILTPRVLVHTVRCLWYIKSLPSTQFRVIELGYMLYFDHRTGRAIEISSF